MALSYFNAVLKSTSFPPYDPWFAGGYINYYYFGYVVSGLWVKLLGLIPSFAYNLIVPTLFALVGVGVFSLGYNLVQADAAPPDGRPPVPARRTLTSQASPPSCWSRFSGTSDRFV